MVILDKLREVVFDPRLGGARMQGAKYRDLKTGRIVSNHNEDNQIVFRCKYCGKTKLLADMRVLTQFFPPVVACCDCERRMW